MTVCSLTLSLALLAQTADPSSDIIADNDVVMRALVDEMQRSMTLQMEDLQKPYFIQYTVDDDITYQMSASYGAITTFNRDRSRSFLGQVRVGSPELDNTNFAGGRMFRFGGGSGGRAALPLDDDYMAIRQAIWWATDNMYKQAVETLTRKQAYMEDKQLEDRPDDLVPSKPSEHLDPGAEVHFDQAAWRAHVKTLSAVFSQYPIVQDSNVRLLIGGGNTYVANSAGTRVRKNDHGVLLIITAETQAEDGMRISDGLSYSGETTNDLPAVEAILKDIANMVTGLDAARNAPYLESYSGPVLFDGHASCQMFQSLISTAIAGSVEPVGSQRRSMSASGNMEKKLNKRILPKSFQIYDDPTIKKHGDHLLFGHYVYDDEGVPAERVTIVENGVLKSLVMSQVPTKKLTGSNGHARRSGDGGLARAAIANLFIVDDKGKSMDELKAELIEAAEDADLEYGILIKSLRSAGIASSQSDLMSFFMRAQRRGAPSLGDPVFAYKVYVEDGREELIRGLEFAPVEARELKNIMAAGNTQVVHNYVGFGTTGTTPATSIIAPAVLFEELELAKIEQEKDKLPILKAPVAR